MLLSRLLTLSSLSVLLVLPVAAGAQLGSRPADDMVRMLDAPNRVASLRVDDVLAKLNLQPGQVVADLGAGTGVFSLPMGRLVGPAGRVYSVEVDQGLVDHIASRIAADGAANVHAVLGRFTDPALPSRDVDLLFIHDVLHHIEDRAGYLKNAVQYLKADGRVAVVEYDGDKGPHKGQPHLQVTREELAGWMDAVGFVAAEEFVMFDDKWYVVYRRR